MARLGRRASILALSPGLVDSAPSNRAHEERRAREWSLPVLADSFTHQSMRQARSLPVLEPDGCYVVRTESGPNISFSLGSTTQSLQRLVNRIESCWPDSHKGNRVRKILRAVEGLQSVSNTSGASGRKDSDIAAHCISECIELAEIGEWVDWDNPEELEAFRQVLQDAPIAMNCGNTHGRNKQSEFCLLAAARRAGYSARMVGGSGPDVVVALASGIETPLEVKRPKRRRKIVKKVLEAGGQIRNREQRGLAYLDLSLVLHPSGQSSLHPTGTFIEGDVEKILSELFAGPGRAKLRGQLVSRGLVGIIAYARVAYGLFCWQRWQFVPLDDSDLEELRLASQFAVSLGS